jgi:hypothetical protein
MTMPAYNIDNLLLDIIVEMLVDAVNEVFEEMPESV